MPHRPRADNEHANPLEREFAIDGEGWVVWEDLRPAPNGPALVFENSKVARRVREYPANWREFTDDQLYALSWSR